MTTKTMNEQMEEINEKIKKWDLGLNIYEQEFKVWNKEGTGYSNWYLLQLLQARKSQLQTDMKIVEELKDKLKKELNTKIVNLQKSRDKLRKLSYFSKEDERIDNILYHKICVLGDFQEDLDKLF